MIEFIENANNWLIIGTLLIIIEVVLFGSFIFFLPAGIGAIIIGLIYKKFSLFYHFLLYQVGLHLLFYGALYRLEYHFLFKNTLKVILPKILMTTKLFKVIK